MKLIIMTESTFFVEEDKILSTLYDEGMDNLHFHKPGSEPVYCERLLTLLPEEMYGEITVHDHFYLKEEYRLKGIHLDSPDVQMPIGYKGTVSRTCQHIDELKEAKKNSNYVFLNTTPYLQGLPSQSFLPSQDELLDAARRGLIDKKVYALGGISTENIRVVKDLGFGGVVVCNDLWSRFNIHNEQDYKELIAHFKKLRKMVD